MTRETLIYHVSRWESKARRGIYIEGKSTYKNEMRYHRRTGNSAIRFPINRRSFL